ncbi:Gfo/Idh/MocA family oxidoreductase [Ancylobacter sp. MQZ15Z-1]|uniref:Gfo/Idh/MocA family oxidoreductase n=1 Tax=Ancylobacter mangrovi TaxID=2972472 RepID=A0A9X2T190_9HYPH|nr:Gfo/Idh/MocA family oxidoreductase [Ancylobacter mangrovi]MCS0494750.1 Gfo/Idh/MocA family oxidoreductase [Ancylobacter mangrovi]
MATRSIRIVMDGVTGRLGQNQHLARSVMSIARDGGLPLANGDRLMPEPILLGRNPDKLAALALAHGGLEWTTDAARVLADPSVAIYFDVAATAGRVERARRAIAAGKHIYLEKPIAGDFASAVGLASAASKVGVKNGVVQDKLYLPGLAKLALLRDTGFFGKILSARLDFGWWVFDGTLRPAQRASWNYRKAAGGGLVLDMFPHWRYIIDHLVGPIRAVSCRCATRVPRRIDENGQSYEVDVEDEAAATFELEGGVLVQVGSSWATRVKRDDLFQLQIDGTGGSAVAGLHDCRIQPAAATPKALWDVDVPPRTDFDAEWLDVPDVGPHVNSYRRGWELFLRHVMEGTPFPSPLIEGAKGVQLAEGCYRSDAERRWIELPPLDTEDVTSFSRLVQA